MPDHCKHCSFNTRAAAVLSEEHFKALSANHLELALNKGDPIIKQGMYSTNVVFLRKGLVKIHITGPYHEQIVRLVKAPTYLGLPTTFGDKINQYSVTAISDVEVCYIDINIFRRILSENREFSEEIITELSQHELELYHRCANRTQKQIRGNMADVLIEFADKIFHNYKFTLPVSQTELANLVDTSRESVNRVLNEFDRDGLIRVKGKNIEVLNMESLKLISKNG